MGVAAGIAGIGLQAAGGLVAAGAQRKAASSYDQQAAIAVQLGAYNRDVIYAGRAQTMARNAKWIRWQGNWEQRRLKQQARQVDALAQLEQSARYLQADYEAEIGNRQKQSFDYEADNVKRFGDEQRQRSQRQGQFDRATQRNLLNKAGLAESGTSLAIQNEQARRLATQDMDFRIRSVNEEQRLRYAGEMAEWQGNTASETTRFNADIRRYQSDSQVVALRNQSYLAKLDAAVRAQNARFAADDLRQEGQLQYLYGLSQAVGLQAQAAGARASATAQAFGALGGAATGLYNITS